MPDPLPRSISHLIEELGRLPTVGPKTAQRLAFFLLRSQPSQAEQLGHAILHMNNGIVRCSQCLNFADQEPCVICADGTRDPTVLCVVEEPLDLLAIERSGGFKGHYHVLHGVISPLDGVGPDDLSIDDLVRRVQKKPISEVIVATNASLEGDATAMEMRRRLSVTNTRVTRLARGLATGGDIEYVDASTIAQALEGRSDL